MKFVVVLAAVALMLGGCGLTTGAVAGASKLPADQQVVLSVLGGDPYRKLALNVLSVDGKKIDQLRTSEVYLPPGQYNVELKLTKDLDFFAGGGMTTTWKGAVVTVPLTAIAGHTYIPNAQVGEGDQFTAYFDDMGIGFNKECLPLRRYAVLYGGSADGKKPGC